MVFQPAVSALELVFAKDHLSDCSPRKPRNASPPGHQSKAVKGYFLEADIKTWVQTYVRTPLWEMLSHWHTAEGECENSSCPLRVSVSS